MKIAFVIQRYGEEVNGGSELSCRWVAEHLSKHMDVEIITSCAVDYVTWKNEYPEGTQIINGVKVNRFLVDKQRNLNTFNKLSTTVFNNPNIDIKEEQKWINEQGPLCTKAISYIVENKNNYDFFIFYTYLYYLTATGLPLVSEKSILVSTAHDEAPIYLKVFQDIFNKPKGIIFLTEEEKSFVNNLFGNNEIKSTIIGTGINLPEEGIDKNSFVDKYNLDKFVLFAGRLEESKGLGQLIEYFQKYKRNEDNEIKLVLIGKGPMAIPKSKNIISLGYVSEEEKFNAIAASELIIVPSPYESLSMISLEAWLMKKSIIVNAQSPVLVGNCQRSNGGLYYNNYEEFKTIINKLIDNPELKKQLGLNGYIYAKENYDWPIIIKKYSDFLDNLSNKN